MLTDTAFGAFGMQECRGTQVMSETRNCYKDTWQRKSKTETYFNMPAKKQMSSMTHQPLFSQVSKKLSEH